MTAPLLLYRMRKDYIKMDKITNKILHFPQNLFFNLKSLIELLIYCYTVLRANDCNSIEKGHSIIWSMMRSDQLIL